MADDNCQAQGTAATKNVTDIGPYPFHRLLTTSTIQTYQILVSPGKGASCPMHPHCSEYGLETFRQFNPLRAFVMTADRLHRCGHDLDNYPLVRADGYLRFYDPVQPTSLSGTRKDKNNSFRLGDDGSGFSFNRTDSTWNSTINTSSDDSLLFLFAESLHQEGDDDRAITEFRRLLFFFPNSPYWSQASTAVLRCFYESGQYRQAIRWGEALLQKKPDLAERNQARLFLGASHFRMSHYPQARDQFQSVAAADSGTLGQQSMLLEGLAYAHEYDWNRAIKTFASIEASSEFAQQAQDFSALCYQGIHLPQKNPALAGVLGIVPGLGYLYDGYPEAALSSLIVNGLFLGGAYEAFRQDQVALGAILAFFTSGWYAGNIYGSVTSAYRRNAKVKRDLLLRMDIGLVFSW
jgi:putative component of membrane protein insertase Oxa1/YidC/SpoIIIJ protein YidD/tetratricopeptide (TPR) repeat protein